MPIKPSKIALSKRSQYDGPKVKNWFSFIRFSCLIFHCWIKSMNNDSTNVISYFLILKSFGIRKNIIQLFVIILKIIFPDSALFLCNLCYAVWTMHECCIKRKMIKHPLLRTLYLQALNYTSGFKGFWDSDEKRKA